MVVWCFTHSGPSAPTILSTTGDVPIAVNKQDSNEQEVVFPWRLSNYFPRYFLEYLPLMPFGGSKLARMFLLYWKGTPWYPGKEVVSFSSPPYLFQECLVLCLEDQILKSLLETYISEWKFKLSRKELKESKIVVACTFLHFITALIASDNFSYIHCIHLVLLPLS